jgi:hypothetical protein
MARIDYSLRPAPIRIDMGDKVWLDWFRELREKLSEPNAVPGSAAAAGVAGDVAYDADYLYICVATDTWKRVSLATWP